MQELNYTLQFIKILESQKYRTKNRLFLYWSLLMDLSISLISDEVKAFLKNSLTEFYRTFDKHDSYKFTLSDIPKIKNIDYRGFYYIRPLFLDVIKTKKYQLIDFFEVFCLGMHLFDSEDKDVNLKTGTKKEKELYFISEFIKFYKRAFSKDIQYDAYIHNGGHSDTILYNSKNTSDYLFIEYAANIEIGEINDNVHKGTILGHLNRIVDDYFKKQIDCFHNTNESKLEDFQLDKAWFIYLGKNIDLKEMFQQISYNKYNVINIVLVSYDFDNDYFKILSRLSKSNHCNIYSKDGSVEVLKIEDEENQSEDDEFKNEENDNNSEDEDYEHS